MRPSGLPSPDEHALEASVRLAGRVAERIAQHGGWIGFDAYMQAVLYEPGLGYYSGGSRKFGEAGDFVTAPELSPVFGACLAAQCAQWFEHVPACLYEFGAGTGALAAQLLSVLPDLGFADVDYVIVELSGELRARQRETIARAVPGARVRWLDAWPARIDGVVVANELLDAMPVRVFRRTECAVFERGVVACAGDTVPRFEWADRPADAAFAARVHAALADAVAHAGEFWPPDYVSELGEQAAAWVAEAGRRVGRGALLLIDYGFPAGEFYHPQRAQGTLMCHYRHRAHDDPFLWPGLQDVTAHVDFSAIAQAGLDAGLDLLGYASQANVLLNLGLPERFTALAGHDPVVHARAAQGVQRLIGDAEMGELFKVIALGRGLSDDAIGFVRADRRHRL